MEDRNKKLLNIIKTALEAEKEGLMTYLKFARTTNDIGGKNMFIRLAMDEFGHVTLLSDQFNDVSAEKGWQHIEIDKSVVEPLIPKINKKDIQTMGKANTTELAALKAASSLEQTGIDFYTANAKDADFPDLRETFEKLAEMELAHYTMIQAEIDSIKKTGFWFDTREYSVEMEA